jgi:hypothetical protein
MEAVMPGTIDECDPIEQFTGTHNSRHAVQSGREMPLEPVTM